MDNIVDTIILKYPVILKLSLNSVVPIQQVLEALISSTSIKLAAVKLDVSESVLEHFCGRKLKPLFPDKGNTKWSTFLVSLSGLKKCTKCLNLLSLETDYYADTSRFLGKRYECKKCTAKYDSDRFASRSEEETLKDRHRSQLHYLSNKHYYIAKARNRDSDILQATPKWANLSEINNFYIDRPEGYEVDHIIPLKGELVCGLHVTTNLQYLTIKDNRSKSNKFTTDTLAESA